MKPHLQELVNAVEALERVMADLDTTATVCPACKRPQANNWSDSKLHRSLSAAQTRIDSVIAQIVEHEENTKQVNEC